MPHIVDDLAAVPAWEILDDQVTLIRWLRSDIGTSFCTNFALSEARTTGQLQTMADWLADYLARSLDTAATYWVTRHMQDMVIGLAREQALPSRIDPTDIPSPHGFVVFDEPVVCVDVHHKTVTWQALQWAPTKISRSADGGVTDLNVAAAGDVDDGVMVMVYTDLRTERDRELDDYLREDPRAMQMRTPYLPLAVGAVPFGEQPVIPEEFLAYGPNQRLVAHAFWLLSQQRVALKTGAHLPRAAVKRWQRFGNRADIPEVIIITLRRGTDLPAERIEPDEDDEASVLWSHRWRVRGHWRRQRCGPRSDNQWRWVWIDSYVKGPDHLPLIEKDAVSKLAR